MSYDPTVGRWLEQDQAGYIDGPNMYQVEKSDPVNLLDPSGFETQQQRESRLWALQQQNAENALNFWAKFLDLREGQNPIGAGCLKKFLIVIRAISWVESQHGTVGTNQPKSDPLQSGNPNDVWWQTVTGQNGQNGDRFIGGPNANNYWTPQLPGATGKPAPAQGHNDNSFTPSLSYFWGIPYLIQLVNKGNGKTYKCGTVTWIK